MAEIILRDIPELIYAELQLRAQRNGHAVEDEALSVIEKAVAREKYVRLAKEEGIGPALQAIGRDFDITDEFDNLRERQMANEPITR